MRGAKFVFAAFLLMCTMIVSPVFAKDAIKVGAILAVTGPASFLGAPEAKTLQMLLMRSTPKAASKARRSN